MKEAIRKKNKDGSTSMEVNAKIGIKRNAH
jgi:hypothetical protein